MTNQQRIGYFIKSLREKKGLTQKDFAKRLATSQSAVARMEAGRQNFTTKELEKISNSLHSKLLSINESVDFRVEGGRKLHGTVITNYSKNGAMGLICASLLNRGKTILHNIPEIEEVNRMIEILEALGVSVSWVDKHSLEIVPPTKFKKVGLLNLAVGQIRSSLMLLGSLAHILKNFRFAHAGGCKMGERTIEAHRHGLEILGFKITTNKNNYEVRAGKLSAGKIVMYEMSDTATENMLIAASLIPGKTIIEFASPNYQVQELCFFLEKCGVKINGVGTSTLEIHGAKEINKKLEYWNSEDPIESMMFLSAAITTGSRLKVKRCPIDFLKLELLKLKTMGLKFAVSREYLSQNGRTKLVDIQIFLSKLKALPDKIHAQAYPGINTDNLPFFVPIATQAKGTTLIHDWMWENRAIYFTELNRLGANITLADPHRVFVNGPTPLKAAQVVCPPALRPAMIILIAMLAAPGISILRNVYSIKRGYEEVAERLNKLGAKIQILRDL